MHVTSDENLWMESDMQAQAIRNGSQALHLAHWRAHPRRMKALERMGYAAPNPLRLAWLERKAKERAVEKAMLQFYSLGLIDTEKLRDGWQRIMDRRANKQASKSAVPTVALELISSVALHGSATADALMGPSRSGHLVKLRAVVAVILRERGWSYPMIGHALGGRDHSTAMNLVDKWPIYVKQRPNLLNIRNAHAAYERALREEQR